jgi:hypothetical protein
MRFGTVMRSRQDGSYREGWRSPQRLDGTGSAAAAECDGPGYVVAAFDALESHQDVRRGPGVITLKRRR